MPSLVGDLTGLPDPGAAAHAASALVHEHLAHRQDAAGPGTFASTRAAWT